MVSPDQEFTLVLTAAECNVILTALSEAPYRVSAPVINKLQQLISQMAPDAFTPGSYPAPQTKIGLNGSDAVPKT